MRKMLFISNICTGITNFSIPSISAVQQLNFEFHMAANFSGTMEDASKYKVILHHIDLVRNPFNLKNWKAFWQMTRLLKKEKIDIIHCNTPIGGILGRLCGRKAKVTKIIYTAHGLHFYKGAPLINKTIFKWVEQWMASFTDAIITMNKEDYQAAQRFKLQKEGKVYYIPGVGVNTRDYQRIEGNQQQLRASLGIKPEDIVLIAVGDLISRKNYATSLQALAKASNSKLHLLICGKGPNQGKLQEQAYKLGVKDQISFLGFRKDIIELLKAADIFMFPSYQEGLPRALMEAMAAGLPCIASNIRGNSDLIEDGKGGCLHPAKDIEGFAKSINALAADVELRKRMGKYNVEVIKKYDIENVKSEMLKIYKEVLSM